MKALKAWVLKKATQVKEWVKAKVLPKIEKAAPWVKVLAWVVLALVVAVLFVAAITGLVFIGILLPGMVVGFFAWLAWTYFGLGATYFAMLDPIYLHIPYWHFAWGFAILILIIRVIRKKGKVTPGEINAHDGSWKLKKSSS